MGFLYADTLLLRINDEDRVRKLLHIADTAKVLLELLKLLLELKDFLLRQDFKCSVFCHGLDFLHACDTALDRLEVRQHTAEPSLIDVIHAAALSFRTDRVLRLLLCSHEEDLAAVLNNINNCVVSVIDHAYRLLKVDNVDAVTLCVDVRLHLGVPASCLMSEMDACFQQLFH